MQDEHVPPLHVKHFPCKELWIPTVMCFTDLKGTLSDEIAPPTVH